jgi:hypothetical protein
VVEGSNAIEEGVQGGGISGFYDLFGGLLVFGKQGYYPGLGVYQVLLECGCHQLKYIGVKRMNIINFKLLHLPRRSKSRAMSFMLIKY